MHMYVWDQRYKYQWSFRYWKAWSKIPYQVFIWCGGGGYNKSNTTTPTTTTTTIITILYYTILLLLLLLLLHAIAITAASMTSTTISKCFKWDLLVVMSSVRGTRWHSWLRHCTTSQKVVGFIPNSVIRIFSLTSFQQCYGPGVDLACNRNEYQEYFLGGNGGQCVGLTTLPPSCADCLESWKAQPPGTLRVCPGL
jgi:hypothetical protein